MKLNLTLLTLAGAFFILALAATGCKKKNNPGSGNNPPVTGTNIPTLTTATVSSITDSTAVSGGVISSAGDGNILAAGVCWSTSQNPVISMNKTSDFQSAMSFNSALSSLLPNTTYYVRAYATNAHGTAYGNEISFTTTKTAKWISWNNGMGDKSVNELITVGSDLYAATSAGVFKSSGGQNNWVAMNNGLPNLNIFTLMYANNVLFAGTSAGAFSSTDGGASWTSINTGFYLTSAPLIDLAVMGTKIYANTLGSGWEEIYMSANSGQQWSLITNLSGIKAEALEVVGSTVYFYDSVWDVIYSSANDGASWYDYADMPSNTFGNMRKLISLNNTLYACTDRGFFSVIPGAMYPIYVPVNPSISSTFNAEMHNNLVYIGINNAVIYSTDNDVTWNTISTGLTTSTGITAGNILALRDVQGTLFAGSRARGVFKLVE